MPLGIKQQFVGSSGLTADKSRRAETGHSVRIYRDGRIRRQSGRSTLPKRLLKADVCSCAKSAALLFGFSANSMALAREYRPYRTLRGRRFKRG